MHRIGVLAANSAANFSTNSNALRQGLRDLGYVEGQNLILEYRFAEGKIDRLPQLAAELIRLNVNVIVASSSPAALALRDATKEIPIVFSTTGDAVASGVVTSLARPGGNLTGVTTGASELYGKRLELLKETFLTCRSPPSCSIQMLLKRTWV
jgi:putative ABC transport system substrate-binding protein